MTPYEIPPFFFPTTVVLVDDSSDFLANVSLQLDANLAFRLFQSPLAALSAINRDSLDFPSVRDFFSLYRDRDDVDESRHVIDISLGMICRQVQNDKRFEQVSVVVVDYDMLELNGLELCRRIRSPLVKKILLTGRADERLAVEAFNEGIIDRFIRKQEPDAMASLNRSIADMQSLYFGRLERMLSDALSVGSPRFLQDKAFAQRFTHIRDQLRIVEYYLTCLPDGMLMLDADGTPYLLIVQNEERTRANYEIAEDQAAPRELLDALAGRSVVPYFWATNGNYSPDYEDWRSCLYPAAEFRGNEWYLYSVVKNPAGLNLKCSLSYNAYLDRLDEMGQERFAAGG